MVRKYQTDPAIRTTRRGGRRGHGAAESISDVTSPALRPARAVDPTDPRIRRSWWVFSAAFLVIVAAATARALTFGGGIGDWALLGVIGVAGGAAILHASAVAALDARSRGEVESFARILSGLSRSVSPDAIVDAIVEELGQTTGADHIVVVRRRPDGPSLQARLVSAHPGVPDHTTPLPISDLDDPIAGRRPTPAEAADRVARRVRDVYGLTQALAAPLTTPDGVVGAIVVSRRVGGPWPETTRRLLGGAAQEASAALARAYSHRAAEMRASTDALTGLPNRHYFDEFVGLLAQRRRAGDAVGILMVDIDRFKALNDRHGHGVGDEVLRAVGSAIVSAVRADDVPARFGGEEFVVLLRDPEPSVAVEVGERIRMAVRALDVGRFGVKGVSVSVGVAVADGPEEPIDALIATADRALYRAKRAGRDRVVAA
jgi:diguanylate cyclase (GGDEF)-like protein